MSLFSEAYEANRHKLREDALLLEHEVLVDVGGVGYELDVPMSTFYNLPGLGEKVSLLTHFVVREDAQQLCGFRKPQIRAYRWCSPPRTGYATMSPNRSTGRLQGASFPSETWVRTSLYNSTT